MEKVRLLKRSAWSTLVLMTMLVVFPWIVTSVIANLRLAQIAGWQSIKPATEPIGETNTLSQVSTEQYVGSSSSEYILAAVSALAALASILIWRIRRRRVKREEWYTNESPTSPISRVTLVLAVGLIVFIFYGLVMLVRNLPNFIDVSYEMVHPDVSRFLIPLTVIFILACSALGLFLFLRSHESSHVQLNASESGLPEEAHKVASVLGRTIYDLKSGKDYRDTVINCYRALCVILESGGVPNDSSLTAREFDVLAVKKLGRSSEYLHQATFLFEGVLQRRFCFGRRSKEIDRVSRKVAELGDARNEA